MQEISKTGAKLIKWVKSENYIYFNFYVLLFFPWFAKLKGNFTTIAAL